MKTKMLAVYWGLSLGMAAHSQGIIYFDGTSNTSLSPTAGSKGRVFLDSGSGAALDTNRDLNVELAYGKTPQTVSPSNAVTFLLLDSTKTLGNGSLGEILSARGDIGAMGNGQLFDPSGTAYRFPGMPMGTKVWFKIYAWTGNFPSYGAASASTNALVGATGVFSEYLVSPTWYPNNIQDMPALILSPSTHQAPVQP